ncbi:RNA ligase (ATP) [Haliscomenobacter sp.]|uniref:RNA ligase (ATP) n=1 Tax=Haliscomenobacter sp. TaxID=2717303 RepID=UPI003BA9F88E
MNRKLASIRQCSELQAIPGADAIQVAVVDGWTCVVKIGEVQLGQKGVYFEIDSFLPVGDPRFEFLRKSSLRKMGDVEGFRLRTIRLRGQLSQGLFLPLDWFPEVDPAEPLGTDLTERLRVDKYEPPIPADLTGKVIGPFPGFIPKTDEERVQNLLEEFANWQGLPFVVTEKLDGTSFTAYQRNGHFGICSRNWELSDEDPNSYWKVAAETQLQEKLSRQNLAIQGEMIGEGIQKNMYKLRGQHLFVFHVFDIDQHRFYSYEETVDFCLKNGLQIVPLISADFQLPAKVEDLLRMADGPSILNEQAKREGLVLRSADRKISFKAISNAFLEAED